MQQSPLSKLCAATLHTSSQIWSPIQLHGQFESGAEHALEPPPPAPTFSPSFGCNSENQ